MSFKSFVLVLSVFFLAACSGGQDKSRVGGEESVARVEGHYDYEHSWDYSIPEGHLYVYEEGIMDFNEDGTALDSARQEYKIEFADGDSVLFSYIYISPSRWRLEGDDFYFSGIKEKFRMELNADMKLVAQDTVMAIAKRTYESVRNGIDREIKFHMDTLTTNQLVWSYTYSDGHTDTWEFYKK